MLPKTDFTANYFPCRDSVPRFGFPAGTANLKTEDRKMEEKFRVKGKGTHSQNHSLAAP